MLPEARVAAKSDDFAETFRSLAQIFEDARQQLAGR
jgi:hypothetical protein